MIKPLLAMAGLSTVLVVGNAGAWALGLAPGVGHGAQHGLPKASFDCRRAVTAAEIAICSDERAAKADRELTAAYRATLSRFSGPARAALRRDQSAFRGARDRLTQSDTPTTAEMSARLADALDERGRALQNWRPAPGSGLVGAWQAAHGTVSVFTVRSGTLLVLIDTHEPVLGGWACKLAFEASLDAGGRRAISTNLANGLRVTVRREGQALSVGIEGPPGSLAARCRGQGAVEPTLEGIFFYLAPAAD